MMMMLVMMMILVLMMVLIKIVMMMLMKKRIPTYHMMSPIFIDGRDDLLQGIPLPIN